MIRTYTPPVCSSFPLYEGERSGRERERERDENVFVQTYICMCVYIYIYIYMYVQRETEKETERKHNFKRTNKQSLTKKRCSRVFGAGAASGMLRILSTSPVWAHKL